MLVDAHAHIDRFGDRLAVGNGDRSSRQPRPTGQLRHTQSALHRPMSSLVEVNGEPHPNPTSRGAPMPSPLARSAALFLGVFTAFALLGSLHEHGFSPRIWLTTCRDADTGCG
jgi:hypothetical protein